MKAEWDDAPSYLRTRGWQRTAKRWAIPGILGTCIALGLLQAGSSALLQGTVRSLAAKHVPPQPTPIAQISRPEHYSERDKWDRIVEEQARRDSHAGEASQLPINQHQTEPPPRQTAFNDRNYTPRGADNVVPLQPPVSFQSEQAQTQGVRVTVVGETLDMKEAACWPLREGSVEKRNCKFRVGLHYRN
ncbi:hypothetical protein D9M68_451890 [compost metagenome]